MQPRSDTVSYELSHYAEAVFFNQLLYGRSNIADGVADPHRVDSPVQRIARHIQQLLQLRRNSLTYRHRDRRISVVAVQHHSAVDRNDIAFLQHPPFRRNAVHHFLVH